jgi:hypothetical protein
MRSHALALTAALLLTACATAPAHLTAAKAAVDGRTEYVYYKGWKKPAGLTKNQGNCTWFTSSYAVELLNNGRGWHWPTLCQVPGGAWHSVLDVDGWRLDNREAKVIPVWASNCLNNRKAFLHVKQ